MKQTTLIEILFMLAICSTLLLLIFGNLGCPVGCGSGYSEGERTGIVTKISYKGIVSKTWEGEMNMGGMTSDFGKTQVNVWNFTVKEKDEELLKKIQEAQKTQKAITLTYSEWLIRPSFQTDSGCFITEAEFVKETKKEGKP